MIETTAVLGINVARIDYDGAVDFILDAAERGESSAISALAVHGLMTGVLDRTHGDRLNQFELLVPDGQPVRWALNWLDGRSRLEDRVYGPELTKRVCEAAARRGVGVYLYGSRDEVVRDLEAQLTAWYPELRIVDRQPSRFRPATPEEDAYDVERINASGAGVVLVGLGCPRQERWAWEHRGRVRAAMLCVGAAFDFLSGRMRQAPPWMQRRGLEWAFRLVGEPRRLWRRYLLLNPLYAGLLAVQLVRHKVGRRGR